MAILYYWDEKKELNHSEFYQDELPTPMPSNATSVAPRNGLYEPITWNGETWVGTDKEVWLAAHPVSKPEPSAQDKANAALALQIAQNKAAQDKFNAQTMLALAQNGGTN
ncbi:hypothetical protein [Lactiplantibacillus plajomi]|uniref:Uncharacterized protein n=1 Tax=Lactiplantibacillus plajomi TaxID=1457217 RepID=A0ABV6K0W8_9LACO|nr:hypothetical protein [Lactiplantibacillus plajomi]